MSKSKFFDLQFNCKQLFFVLMVSFLSLHVSIWGVATGTVPHNVVSADFNGDGFSDIAVTNSNLFTVTQLTVYLNDQTGNFVASPPFTLGGASPAFSAIGDFNNNGSPDIAVLVQNSHEIVIFLNNGSGVFTQLPTTVPVAAIHPFGITTGNFRGNGRQDIAIAGGGDGGIELFYSNGDGTFTAGPIIPTATPPSLIAAGDLNNDGVDDLVVVFTSQNSITVYLNNGTGGFISPGTSYPVGTFPSSVALGKFTNSGLIDIAVANMTSNNVSVLLNQGAGTYSSAVNYPVQFAPLSLTTGQFSGNVPYDIFVANEASSTVSFLQNNGDGTFAAAVNTEVGSAPVSITAGQFLPNSGPTFIVTNVAGGDTTTGPVTPIAPGDILPPQNLKGTSTCNQFLTQTDFINVLTWDPPAAGQAPVEYRIFRDAALTEEIGAVPGNRRTFEDHNRKFGETYTYFVVSVGARGAESNAATVTVTTIKKCKKCDRNH
jgi:hypothetical protein